MPMQSPKRFSGTGSQVGLTLVCMRACFAQRLGRFIIVIVVVIVIVIVIVIVTVTVTVTVTVIIIISRYLQNLCCRPHGGVLNPG
jgi:Flp pilus assembly protein TadB